MNPFLTRSNINLKRDKGLVVYTFLAIFQPPFLPIAFIYILGLYTIIWLYYNANKTTTIRIFKASKILWLSKIFLFFFFYILIIGTIDQILIEPALTISTRLRSINQLVVLSFIEFAFIWYLLIHFNRLNYNFRDIITIIIISGILQGIFALSAFTIPQLRKLYMMFGDQTLYGNAYFIERRGYGFSMILIDTFGYGMGLIAGYMILLSWIKKKIMLILSLGLILFTIVINARTGIIVFLVAIIIKFLSNKNIGKTICSIIFTAILSISLYSNVPVILEIGRMSDNATISWISGSFSDLYYLLNSSNTSTSLELDEVGFLSNFIELPNNTFEFLFGTGHHVYDTESTLGFRTDIGYYNLLWEFGIIGTIAILLYLGWFIIQPFFITKDLELRRIALFNLITYSIVLMKAILIGFSPGGFINYLVTFSLYYCLNSHIYKCAKMKKIGNYPS